MTNAVLLIRRGGLGDTLLLLPVLAALRRRHPAAELHVAGVAEFTAVLAQYGAVDRARSSEEFAAAVLPGERGAAARAELRRYANLVADDAQLLAAAGLPAAQAHRFDPRPRRDDQPLAVQIAAQLGLTVSLADAVLVAERVAAPPAAPVVLAPGSGGRSKCWPPVRWRELAAALQQAGRAVAVVVGPVERERDDPRAWCWPVAVDFLADLACTALAERLAAACAFVGNDSGVTHLAAALRVPTVAVFGPGRPAVYAPPGAHVQIVGDLGPGPPTVGVAPVLAAVARSLV